MPKQEKTEYRFLIVDDECDGGNLETITSLFWSNVTVQRVGTNNRALEALRSQSYDVIFYDLGMENGVWGGGNYPITHRIRESSSRAVLIGISAHPQSHPSVEDVDAVRDKRILLYQGQGELQRLLQGYGIDLERRQRKG
ncbi:MAG TPA: hypothetical protein VJI15_03015 [Candidatus Nanoarchaeia archaeon]|nr:hypothetical protein [Candidatus Nanoarchaeia archaeon]